MKKTVCISACIFTLFIIPDFLFSQKVSSVFLNQSDTTSNKYLCVKPDKEALGLLFLIPSFNESPYQVLQQTNIPNVAAQKSILTIIPTFSTGLFSFGVDSATQSSLKNMIDIVFKKYNLQDTTPFYIGGFSIGGSCAVKYAELANDNHYAHIPKAIFAIDPPLDFERFYNSSKRIIRISRGVIPVMPDVTYMMNRIEQEMGGTPDKAIKNYYKISPYSFNDTTQTAIKGLLHTPLLIFTEPDINWWIRMRGYDVTDINLIDESRFINELNRLGNFNANLIITNDKGYREPGHYHHPHSWSIADANKLTDWLLNNQKEY
jgi:hypothetical protein